MIVKFHPRGRGAGAGPVDYLLGKDRQRAGATVLQGKPEEVRELIDASAYAKKYTSGVLSFAEQDIAPGQRETLMASFERVLMPGLDKDQYSVLWVEHQDKGRLELNFLIPNTELLTGKRLQPYYDRADRPRIDAWQTIVNGRFGLHDPNAPENRRALVTPSALPAAKQDAAASITQGLLNLAAAGELQTRHDVTAALENAGFEVVRTTKSSISIADPDGGRNIRLKGAIYEQSFDAGEGFREEIERAAALYRADAQNRIQRAREVCKRGTELKRADNQRRHRRPQLAAERIPAGPQGDDGERVTVKLQPRAAYDGPDVADNLAGYSAADGDVRRSSVVAGQSHQSQPGGNGDPERHAAEAQRTDMGRDFSGGQQRTFPGAAGRDHYRHGSELDGCERQYKKERDKADTGAELNDGTGKTVAERIRATTAGLLEKAGRMGERLRGMAEDVWHYATGEREAERSREQLESAGAELKRSGKALEPVVYRHEIALYAERQRQNHENEQRQKLLEQQQKQSRPHYGPKMR